jgi:hypothetical protein
MGLCAVGEVRARAKVRARLFACPNLTNLTNPRPAGLTRLAFNGLPRIVDPSFDRRAEARCHSNANV